MKSEEAPMAEQEQLILTKTVPDRRRKTTALIVVLAILLIIAICVIAFLAYFWDKKILNMYGDLESLQDNHDTMKEHSLHKEKHYNRTMSRLIEDLEVIISNHTDHVDEFQDHQLAHNKTIDILQQILNNPDILDAIQNDTLQTMPLSLRSISNQAAGFSHQIYMVLCLLSMYFGLQLVQL